VDYLFTGPLDGPNPKQGLLHYSGLDSGKHEGQLKRIAGPVVGLIRYLVSIDSSEFLAGGENVFYERFIQLSMDELVKINFPKHILNDTGGVNHNKSKIIPGNSRLGSGDDAMALLSILIRDHRNLEGENDPIDVNYLLRENPLCKEKLQFWLQRSASEQVE
jgi:hypothetical protein